MINNRYKINKKLGEGRSKVYRCTDMKTGSEYAMKVVPPSLTEEELKKFEEEYLIISRLNHPGIIKAYDYGIVLESSDKKISYGSRFIILELFSGNELSGLKNISEAGLTEIIIGIASALQYLHMSNLVYFDLKPENILVSGEDKDSRIKIIDFGFAKSPDSTIDKNTRGTAEYIAPELLKKELYDHRVDFYSLGILLYKIIYGTFPFDNSSEIKIFRAQLEDNFRFPQNNYSSGINSVMQKLLQKEPASRYLNAAGIFNDLKYVPSVELLSAWTPAQNFSGRKDVLNILKNYMVNYASGDVFVLKGAEGSGKTALLNKFAQGKKNVVLSSGAKTSFGIGFINSFLEKFLYNEGIHPLLDEDLKTRIKNFLAGPPHHIIEEVKGIFSQIVRTGRFLLLVDDFNFLDELSQQMFREIIPLFQVHNIKIVITENSDRPGKSDFIHNLHQLELSPFTDNQVQEMLQHSLYSYYPVEELKKLILLYADLLPGSIDAFIKDLILFGIIKFNPDSITIASDENTIEILKHSHEHFYKLRTNNLSKEELLAAKTLSAFQTLPDRQMFSEIAAEELQEPGQILNGLRSKNILHLADINNVSFTSAGMKDYIYSCIENKKNIHLKNAARLEKVSPLNKKEIGYQYESAGEHQKSINCYMTLFKEALLIDAYNYQKQLLENMISFPVPEEQKAALKFEMSKVLLNSGDAVSALEQCDELLLYNSEPEILNELLLLKGIALIRSGKSEEGIKQIEHLVDVLEDEKRKRDLLTEIASAYLDINNFSRCEELSREIIDSRYTAEESRGKCYNFLGLISIYRDNDFDKAYEYFRSAEEIYSTAGLKFRTAQMQANLGNIKNIKGENDAAESLWNSSLELNSSMGNLQHEAIVLLNFGVLSFMKLDYEKSIEYYKRALSIFSHTGDQRGEGLVNHNLGEIYYLSCEYGNALKYIRGAHAIFENLQDVNEELETLFLKGIFYAVMGSNDNLGMIIDDFTKLLIREAGEKHKYNLRFLKLLLNSKSLNFYHEIKSIIQYYNKQSVKHDFFMASITAVKFLYENQLYNEAMEELRAENLIAAVETNLFYKAEWEFYCGLVSAHLENSSDHPSEHFLRAVDIVENLSISEITWKIMIELADFYYARGNFLRAEEYAYYSGSLIEHIAGSIDDEELKNSYLSKKEIKDAFEIIRKILPNNG